MKEARHKTPFILQGSIRGRICFDAELYCLWLVHYLPSNPPSLSNSVSMIKVIYVCKHLVNTLWGQTRKTGSLKLDTFAVPGHEPQLLMFTTAMLHQTSPSVS